MGYIYENTNTVRITGLEKSTGWEYIVGTFDAQCEYKIDQNIDIYENWNHELIVDDYYTRMQLIITFNNRSGINSQNSVRLLLHMINLVNQGTHTFNIWPSWDEDMAEGSLDKFNCIPNGPYDIKSIHDFLKSGNSFKIKFKEITPQINFVPAIPVVAIPPAYGLGAYNGFV